LSAASQVAAHGAAVNAVEPGVLGAFNGGGREVAWPSDFAGDFGAIDGGEGNQVQAGAQDSAIGGGALS
jgi:hypothetical protein